MEKLQNYINGKLVEPVSKNYFDNFEPAAGKAYSLIPDSDERDIQLAYEAAENAFEEWSSMTNEVRSKILLKVSQLISANLEKFAQAESKDNGKPVSLAREVDIPRAVKNFEFFATAILHFASESHFTNQSTFNYTLRQPIGVVGAISPWNLPLYLFTWKIAPALAAGNTIVAKPSEVTPYTAYLLSQICIEAGMPEGVLNIVHGLGGKTGSAISSHPGIKAITFTGGTKTGAEIAKVAAPMFKKLSLELGGKNPVLIFDDCNYEKMLDVTVRSSFSNQGEICLCGSRIFIHKNIYDKFKNDFVERVKLLKVGDPNDEQTQQGAIVSKQHYEKILSYISLAQEEGGTILCGGKPAADFTSSSERCKDGWFIEPAVIENLPYNCRTNQEEIFGPVVSLISFNSEDEALMMTNSTEYGLASVIWTESISRAQRISQKIKSGIVWVNCWMERDLRTPFGGVKNSGVGREGGLEALRFFTEPKNVTVKI
ncbi:MAG: aldehyde dehydrogenase [Ignavibacteria bacterium]|nr:aldehyde dehydrogenase [Ignavibacteria bacterium]